MSETTVGGLRASRRCVPAVPGGRSVGSALTQRRIIDHGTVHSAGCRGNS
ncbi:MULTISPECIES: hypothetical protein [Pseudonocardia]|nr:MULTISPECIES: hypothetical protein [Pseudonocardia]MCF7547967.1 hypothetical protein [Pseudonocardia sp. WMMC193]